MNSNLARSIGDRWSSQLVADWEHHSTQFVCFQHRMENLNPVNLRENNERIDIIELSSTFVISNLKSDKSRQNLVDGIQAPTR